MTTDSLPPQAPSKEHIAMVHKIRATHDARSLSWVRGTSKAAQLIADHVAQQTEAISEELRKTKVNLDALRNYRGDLLAASEAETEALRAENARLHQTMADQSTPMWKALDQDRFNELAQLRAKLQESADREKGLREALERIRSGIPACSQEGCLYIAHFDQDGTETGIEQVDPLAVIQSIVGLVDSALTAHPPQTVGT